jgi:aminoglycoside 3-N-acetyltransferase
MSEPAWAAESRIAADLAALGVRCGGVLLVHSSLRSLGPGPGRESPSDSLASSVDGGAESAIRGLLTALGPGGTLLMPALSYEGVGAHHPIFDVTRTPSCVGALPEYFRLRPGTMRSVHPTHSVCGVGARAVELLADHQLDTTPCGPRSPFYKLPEAGGQVLFLGCGLRPNTSMHAIEELVEPPYLFDDFVDYRVILADRTETAMRVRSHDFRGWMQRYDRLGLLLDGAGLRRGPVLQAAAELVECRQMWERALSALRADPLFFVEKIT